jgi:hypothetical protein
MKWLKNMIWRKPPAKYTPAAAPIVWPTEMIGVLEMAVMYRDRARFTAMPIGSVYIPSREEVIQQAGLESLKAEQGRLLMQTLGVSE